MCIRDRDGFHIFGPLQPHFLVHRDRIFVQYDFRNISFNGPKRRLGQIRTFSSIRLLAVAYLHGSKTETEIYFILNIARFCRAATLRQQDTARQHHLSYSNKIPEL